MVTASKTPVRRATARRAAPALPPPAKAPVAAMPTPTASQAAPPSPAQPAPPKVAKASKEKLVRDDFRMPEAEYAVLSALKNRAAGLGHAVKKGVLLRAGIQALAVMSDSALATALKNVPGIARKG